MASLCHVHRLAALLQPGIRAVIGAVLQVPSSVAIILAYSLHCMQPHLGMQPKWGCGCLVASAAALLQVGVVELLLVRTSTTE